MTRKNIRAVSRGHGEATVESLRKDPKFAVEYLNAVLQEGDEQELMVAMRRIADAMGGVPQLASKTKLNATSTCADRRSARRCRRRIGPPPLSHGLSRFDRGRIEGTSLWRRWHRLYKSAIYGSNSIPSAFKSLTKPLMARALAYSVPASAMSGCLRLLIVRRRQLQQCGCAGLLLCGG
jgi:hypothetical protein